MKIFNIKALESGTATVLVLHTFLDTLSSLAKHNYKSKLAEAGLETNQVAYVSLFSQKPNKVGVAELRFAMQELEEILKVSNINVIVDCTSYRDDKGKYSSGLIFSKIFGKDTSLWKNNGIYKATLGEVSCKFICEWRSPSIIREKDSKKIIDSEFIVDFDKANIIKVTDGNVAKDILRKLHKENDIISYDLETSSLRWEIIGGKVLTAQMTGNTDPYTSYVFFVDHKDVPTTNNMKSVLGKGIKWILESGKKIDVHNMNFDLLWTKRHLCPDLDFYKINGYDTMIIHHFLTNSIHDVSNGLKESSFINKVASDWEGQLDIAKKEICQRDKLKLEDFTYEMFDVDMLTRYAGLDTIVLCEYRKMLERLNEEHPARVEVDIIQETWKDNWQSIMQSVQWQIWYGLPFDIGIAKKQLKEHTETVTKLLQEILEDENTAKAMQVVNLRAFDKAKVAYQKKCDEALAKGKEFKGKAPEWDVGSYGTIKYNEEFNTGSLVHKRVLFFDILKLPILNKTDSGLPACGAGELLEYCEKYPQHKVLTNFGQIAKIEKEVGTYLEPFIKLSETSFDGRLRTNFVPLNKSLRMRASSPNLLNLPKTQFKKCITEANGNFIYQIDYAQLEAILALNITEDEARLAQYNLNIIDSHAVNAIIRGQALKDPYYMELSVTNPEDVLKVKKEKPADRQSSKQITFALLYLSSHRAIQFGLGISEQDALTIYNNYWATYRQEREFYYDTVKRMAENGYLRFFGNGCILTPDTENTPDDADTLKLTRLPFNTQMQSGAFLTLKAMDKVQRKYFNLDGFKPFLSVYDSLVYSCKDEDAIMLRKAFLEEMTKPYKENQVVPLQADTEVGFSYKAEMAFEGNEEELKEILKEMRNI